MDLDIIAANLILAILVCSVVVICRIVNNIQKKVVIENSVYYKSVLLLNERTRYHNHIGKDGHLSYTMRVNSKGQFDRTTERKALDQYLSREMKYVEWALNAVSENRKTDREYSEESGNLVSTITPEECKILHISYKRFIAIEQRLVAAKKLNIIKELSLTCRVEYTSPQGRNEYSKECTFLESEVRIALSDYKQREIWKLTEEYRRRNERSKVTPTVRYEVMKRDKFRCRLCGRSADNGVELHVDHIIPISKGGTTTYSNLQTLCRDCNLGKGTKV